MTQFALLLASVEHNLVDYMNFGWLCVYVSCEQIPCISGFLFCHSSAKLLMWR